jgi:hypothetical protein
MILIRTGTCAEAIERKKEEKTNKARKRKPILFM